MGQFRVGETSPFFQRPEWGDLRARHLQKDVRNEAPRFSTLELTRTVELDLGNGRVKKAEAVLRFEPAQPLSVSLTVKGPDGDVSQTLERTFFDGLPAPSLKGRLKPEHVETPFVHQGGGGKVRFSGLADLRRFANALDGSFPRDLLSDFFDRTGFREAVPGLGMVNPPPLATHRPAARKADPAGGAEWRGNVRTAKDAWIPVRARVDAAAPEVLSLEFGAGKEVVTWQLGVEQFLAAWDATDAGKETPAEQRPHDPETGAWRSESDVVFWSDPELCLSLYNGTEESTVRFENEDARKLAERIREARAHAQPPESSSDLALSSPELRTYLFDTDRRSRQLPEERLAEDARIDRLVADLGSPPDLVRSVEALRKKHPAIENEEDRLVRDFNDGFDDWLKGL